MNPINIETIQDGPFPGSPGIKLRTVQIGSETYKIKYQGEFKDIEQEVREIYSLFQKDTEVQSFEKDNNRLSARFSKDGNFVDYRQNVNGRIQDKEKLQEIIAIVDKIESIAQRILAPNTEPKNTSTTTMEREEDKTKPVIAGLIKSKNQSPHKTTGRSPTGEARQTPEARGKARKKNVGGPVKASTRSTGRMSDSKKEIILPTFEGDGGHGESKKHDATHGTSNKHQDYGILPTLGIETKGKKPEVLYNEMLDLKGAEYANLGEVLPEKGEIKKVQGGKEKDPKFKKQLELFFSEEELLKSDRELFRLIQKDFWGKTPYQIARNIYYRFYVELGEKSGRNFDQIGQFMAKLKGESDKNYSREEVERLYYQPVDATPEQLLRRIVNFRKPIKGLEKEYEKVNIDFEKAKTQADNLNQKKNRPEISEKEKANLEKKYHDAWGLQDRIKQGLKYIEYNIKHHVDRNPTQFYITIRQYLETKYKIFSQRKGILVNGMNLNAAFFEEGLKNYLQKNQVEIPAELTYDNIIQAIGEKNEEDDLTRALEKIKYHKDDITKVLYNDVYIDEIKKVIAEIKDYDGVVEVIEKRNDKDDIVKALEMLEKDEVVKALATIHENNEILISLNKINYDKTKITNVIEMIKNKDEVLRALEQINYKKDEISKALDKINFKHMHMNHILNEFLNPLEFIRTYVKIDE